MSSGAQQQAQQEQFDPRYPIGRPRLPAEGATVPEPDRLSAIRDLAELPEQLRNAVSGLDHAQLATPYREGGWTVRQVVHHLADSHTQSVNRTRSALTLDWPPVQAYDEQAWARLHDAADAPVEWSLELLEALHARWVMLLQSVAPEDWTGRGILHSENGRMSLDLLVQRYAWHSRHHVAHINHLRAARGW